jgi:hypothetical protein
MRLKNGSKEPALALLSLRMSIAKRSSPFDGLTCRPWIVGLALFGTTVVG